MRAASASALRREMVHPRSRPYEKTVSSRDRRVGRSREAASPTIANSGGSGCTCACGRWNSRLRRCVPPYGGAFHPTALRMCGSRRPEGGSQPRSGEPHHREPPAAPDCTCACGRWNSRLRRCVPPYGAADVWIASTVGWVAAAQRRAPPSRTPAAAGCMCACGRWNSRLRRCVPPYGAAFHPTARRARPSSCRRSRRRGGRGSAGSSHCPRGRPPPRRVRCDADRMRRGRAAGTR